MRVLVHQLVVLSLVGLAAPVAAQTDARLLGTWEVLRVVDADGKDITSPRDSGTLTFLESGMALAEAADGDTFELPYRVANDTIVFATPEGLERLLVFRFEGIELALTEPEEHETVYLRRVEGG